MALFALVADNVVMEVKELSEAEEQEALKRYSMIVSIDNETDIAPGWVLVGNKFQPKEVLTQYDRDVLKFSKRAKVKNQIIAEMAAENIARVYAGTWTELDLLSLSSDAQLNEILSNIDALAYEIAYAKLWLVDNTLITVDIKIGWAAKLASHFYN